MAFKVRTDPRIVIRLFYELRDHFPDFPKIESAEYNDEGNVTFCTYDGERIDPYKLAESKGIELRPLKSSGLIKRHLKETYILKRGKPEIRGTKKVEMCVLDNFIGKYNNVTEKTVKEFAEVAKEIPKTTLDIGSGEFKLELVNKWFDVLFGNTNYENSQKALAEDGVDTGKEKPKIPYGTREQIESWKTLPY